MMIPRSLLTNSDLKARGWTKAMIVTLLGKGDVLRPSLYRESGSQIQLYRVSRVEIEEKKTSFLARKAKGLRHSQAGLKAAEKRRVEATGRAANSRSSPAIEDTVEYEERIQRGDKQWELDVKALQFVYDLGAKRLSKPLRQKAKARLREWIESGDATAEQQLEYRHTCHVDIEGRTLEDTAKLNAGYEARFKHPRK